MATSSRRARLEQRRAQRNLVVAVVLAIIIGLGFVFFLMPLLFNLVIDWSRGQTPAILITDNVPPQRPIFTPLPDYTNESKLTIEGFTEANAKAELFVDAQSKQVATADDEGNFSFSFNLDEGEHSVVVTAADEAGNTSDSPLYNVTVDLTAPTIEITEPANKSIFTLRSEKVATIKGQMSEPGKVMVNDSFTSTDDEGNFSVPWSLGEGDNKLEIRGEDKAGNTSSTQELELKYQP